MDLTVCQKIENASSARMETVPDASVQLIVTSPPYPMIEMWDPCFAEQDPAIAAALKAQRMTQAFSGMHGVLERTWREADRVLSPGGIVCINIGDAARTCGGIFQLYPNHAMILSFFQSMGYTVLPDILWRKPSNAPNKFMGSGMYPPGAYVTYEHEYILIFRKGERRVFKSMPEKRIRRESAYFWEERNLWFSDLWQLNGTAQSIKDGNQKGRERSAAFPFELGFRLVNMFSVKGDTVLDPFAGLGTVLLACMASQRSGIGYEIDSAIAERARQALSSAAPELNRYIDGRIENHLRFLKAQRESGKDQFYTNLHHGFGVKTRQETELCVEKIASVTEADGGRLRVTYEMPAIQ